MSVAISRGRQSDTVGPPSSEHGLEVPGDAVGVVPAGDLRRRGPDGGVRVGHRDRAAAGLATAPIIGRSLGMSPKTRTSPKPTP